MIPRETTSSISCSMSRLTWGWPPMSSLTGANRKPTPGLKSGEREDTPIRPPGRLRCVHRWFEAQAARRPGAVAVATAAGTVSYGELNARANRLARRLRALGVGPEVPVGLCAGRTAGMVAGLLGVLK